MDKPKRLCDVSLCTATVSFVAKDMIGFLSPDHLIYWLNLGEKKGFSGMGYCEGAVFWVYLAKEVGEVVSVVRFSGELIEDMPPITPMLL